MITNFSFIFPQVRHSLFRMRTSRRTSQKLEIWWMTRPAEREAVFKLADLGGQITCHNRGLSSPVATQGVLLSPNHPGNSQGRPPVLRASRGLQYSSLQAREGLRRGSRHSLDLTQHTFSNSLPINSRTTPAQTQTPTTSGWWCPS